ncbi:MAG: histidine kinase [Deltaproteobacteria bacterium]|nr:MAG: histidine kinase [Deltaproteobacteria bacterium]
MEEKEKLKRDIAEMEARLEEMKKNIPAHSVKPQQIIAIEELEEEISEAKKRLNEGEDWNG